MSELFISAFSSFETIRKRVKSGQEYAKNVKGVKIGRPMGSKLTIEKFLNKHSDIVAYTTKGLSIAETAKLTGKSHQTVSTVRKYCNY